MKGKAKDREVFAQSLRQFRCLAFQAVSGLSRIQRISSRLEPAREHEVQLRLMAFLIVSPVLLQSAQPLGGKYVTFGPPFGALSALMMTSKQ